MFKDFNMLVGNILLFFIARFLFAILILCLLIAIFSYEYSDGGNKICYVDQVGLFGKVSKAPTSCANLYHDNVFKK
jgi:hypothetical protein